MALVQISETPRWKKLLGFVGPGFLVSVAYLDPGNRMLVYLTFKKETPPLAMNVVGSDQAQLRTEPNIDSPTESELQVEIVCSDAQASSLERVHDMPLN